MTSLPEAVDHAVAVEVVEEEVVQRLVLVGNGFDDLLAEDTAHDGADGAEGGEAVAGDGVGDQGGRGAQPVAHLRIERRFEHFR